MRKHDMPREGFHVTAWYVLEECKCESMTRFVDYVNIAQLGEEYLMRKREMLCGGGSSNYAMAWRTLEDKRLLRKQDMLCGGLM